MKTIPVYALWGFRFRVERLPSGKWYGVGRQAGRPAYPLYKLGFEDTEEAMQVKLEVLAAHNHAKDMTPRPVNEKQLALI